MSSRDPNSQIFDKMGLKPGRLAGRVAIVTGGSRGIGREVALALARLGCSVVIAAKTVKPHPTLPGTIHTVAAEVRALGARALAYQVDLRDAKTIDACVEAVVAEFGRVDILINNASALWWQDIVDTPASKYDLITSINVRGTFLMTRACLPHMKKQGFGRVVTMSPPISNKVGAFAGRTAYNVSKMGMTMVAMGVAAECPDADISGHSLWPATIVESLASKNFKMGVPDMWRKATIISDATVGLVCDSGDFSGQQLIDDEYLAQRWGFQPADFVRYRCNPEVEPPRLLAAAEEGEGHGFVKRGAVARLDDDMKEKGAMDKLASKL
jgi:citronellol/citronellal dehydrogenase